MKSKRINYSYKWHRPISLFKPGKPGDSEEKKEEPLDKEPVELMPEEPGLEERATNFVTNQPADEEDQNQDANDTGRIKNIVEELYLEKFGDMPPEKSPGVCADKILTNYSAESHEEYSPVEESDSDTDASSDECILRDVTLKQVTSPVECEYANITDVAESEQTNDYFNVEKTPDEPVAADTSNHVIYSRVINESLPEKEKDANSKSAVDILGKLQKISEIMKK